MIGSAIDHPTQGREHAVAASSATTVLTPMASTGIATARCVVVGAGSIGRRHLRNFTALGVECLALRSGRGQAGSLADWPAVSSWADVAAWNPTLAIIANPTSLHATAACEAMAMGCHVLVEKPVSDSVDGARLVQQAAVRAGRVALVGYQFRFHPTLMAVRGWIAEGVIGDVLCAQAHWGEYLPDWHPGEDHRAGYSARRTLGGGVVRTLSHPIDYLRWLLGEVRAVGAMTSRRARVAVDVEEIAAITLRLDDDVIATLTLDYAERPARHVLHVTGTGGTIEWDALTGVARAWDAVNGVHHVATPDAGFERNVMFMDEARHMLDCIAGRETPRCTIADGVRAMDVVDAILRSAQEGRVIDVD